MTDNPGRPPAREGTVFISYTRADDEKPPYEDATQGWVRFFWDQLRWELTDRGAKRAKLWLDRYEIEPADAFTPLIEEAVRGAQLLVPVLSENWVRTEWCRREVDLFVHSHDDAGARIVPVFKNEPPRTLLPEVMQGDNARVGFRFFTQDNKGELHEFYWRGLQDRTAYFVLLRQIAQLIVERLDLETSGDKEEPVARRTIFLGVAAHELRDARQRIVNDLSSAGVAVVPAAIDALPDTAVDYERVIRDALSRAELAVHLLGENRGITLDGGAEPVVDLQLRLSRETGAGRPLHRILWAPRWLPGQGKRDPFEVVGRFGGLQSGEEIYGEEVTDLSQWLRKRLQPAVEAPILAVASAVADDDDLVADLANRLQGLGPSVKVVFAGGPIPALGEGAILMLLWAKADQPALEALLARVPAGARCICLRFPGGDEAAKRRFFREGVYLEKIEAVPADREQARELLERLEISYSTDRAR